MTALKADTNVQAKEQATVLIMAGGTGGHVIPALSVAKALQARGVNVAWLGTQRGIEARLVPAAGIPIYWLNIGGLRGKGLTTRLLAPFKIVAAVFQALNIIHRLKPQAVLGMGGYVSGPGGVAARLAGKRLVIHEQNAQAGMTNRWLAKLTPHVAAAYKTAFGEQAQLLGNPVREEINALPLPAQRYAERSGNKLNLLVLGGSQGAQTLNWVVPECLALLAGSEFRLNVVHQCGAAHSDAATLAYAEYCPPGMAEYEVVTFIDDMAAAYAKADLVICRSGALTVAEVCAAGLAAIFIPFPYAVDDHQTKNAAALVAADAALLIQETELSANSLQQAIAACAAPGRLAAMASSARNFANPAAAEQLADLCLGETA